MLYLLHFDPPVRRAQHYLGCCKDERVFKRLDEHARGRGAALTRAAARQGSAIYWARAFPGLSYPDERRIKDGQRLADLCPMCCEMLRPTNPEPYRLKVVLPAEALWLPVMGWTTAPKSP